MEVRLFPRLTLGLLTLAAISLLVLSAPRVHADAQQDARALFDRGVEASRAERWQEARILFERSLSLVVKPSTLLNLAISYIKLGRGAEAIEQLDAFGRVATPDEHGPMIQRAGVLRAQAQALIDNAHATATHRGQALSEERARSEEGLSEVSRREVVRAREAFARGDDREALIAFERAYVGSPRPELLYNIGVVADRLRDDERAVLAYDAFASALPDAPETAVAQVRSAALRTALAERKRNAQKRAEAAKQQSAQAERPVPSAAPPPDLRVPRAVLISGVTLCAGSAAVLGKFIERNIVVAKCDERGCNEPSNSKIRDQRDKLRIASIVIGGAAVATTAVGAAWLVRRKNAPTTTLGTLTLQPDVQLGVHAQYGLQLTGRF